jgi:hypothetical protein
VDRTIDKLSIFSSLANSEACVRAIGIVVPLSSSRMMAAFVQSFASKVLELLPRFERPVPRLFRVSSALGELVRRQGKLSQGATH